MTPGIERIESHLGVPLLADLRELYAQGDGESPDDFQPYSTSRAMRLMSADEVIENYDRSRLFGRDRGWCMFWAGGNGEYAAAYLTGPLTGRVYIWDYDGRHDSIAFRSMRSFVASMDELAASDPASNDWPYLATDYYVDSDYFYRGKATCKPATADEIAADVESQRQLRAELATAQIKDELDEHHYAFNLMALTPLEQTASIMEFLDSDDMWIQARACDNLGHRRFEPATSKLGEIARAGTANGRSAARRALGRIGSRDAVEQLLQCIPHVEKGAEYQLFDALAACGCETRKANIDPRGIESPDYLFRLPGETEWRKL
jgi:hypothetical protein